MRSAINNISAVRRSNKRNEGALTTAMLPMQSAWHAVTASIMCRGWLLPLVMLFRQPLALWRLRQRLARCELSVPFLGYFSAREIDEIDRALNKLDLIGDQDAANTWRQLCAPFITGDHAGIDAAGILIRHGIVKPWRCGPAGDTLLHTVARRGIVTAPREARGRWRDLSIEARVHLLVSLGADPDQPNAFGDVPLQLAWERASELGNRTAGALLESGCNPMKRNRFGTTLLHRAARSNNFAVVRGWCDAGLQTNPTGGLREGRALLRTPLMFAVMAGHRRCVDVLIDKERRAIALGKAQIVEGRRLVEEGRLQSEGALQQIAAGERLVAQGRGLLASACASVDFTDSCGATALHWAIDYGRSDLAELLLACGADRGKRAGRITEFSWTPMQLAAARAHLQSVRPILSLLLKYGVYPDQPLRAVDQSGWQRACNEGFQR